MAFNEAEVTDAVVWGKSFLQKKVKLKGSICNEVARAIHI